MDAEEGEPKPKSSLLRSAVKGTARLGWKATKATARVTTKATAKTAVLAAKGGWITMKGGGRMAILGARKAFPKREGESRGQYRIRVAKLGFKVSFWSGYIIAMAAGGPGAKEIANRARTAYEVAGVASTARELLAEKSSTEPPELG